MKFFKGNGNTRQCCKCDKLICSNDRQYNFESKPYCTGCGRIKSLHNRFNTWLKSNYLVNYNNQLG